MRMIAATLGHLDTGAANELIEVASLPSNMEPWLS